MWSKKPGHALRPLLSACGRPRLSSKLLYAWLPRPGLCEAHTLCYCSDKNQMYYILYDAANVTWAVRDDAGDSLSVNANIYVLTYRHSTSFDEALTIDVGTEMPHVIAVTWMRHGLDLRSIDVAC